MHKSARLSAILDRLGSGGTVDVGALAKELAASQATIRRDLATLERQRLLQRTHGGAVAHAVSYELPLRYKGGRFAGEQRRRAGGAVAHAVSDELPLRYKGVRFAAEKRRIAAAAAGTVAEGMAVGLTGGTTATEGARALAHRAPLTIVTHA